MSLSGTGWYAKVTELIIISEDPKGLISKQTRLLMDTATILPVDRILPVGLY